MKKFLFLILVICLIGCGSEDGDSEASKSVIETREGKAKIFPLEIGVSWIYEVKTLDTAVNALRVIRVDTLSIIDDTIIDGTKWYEIDGLAGEKAYGTNWQDGLYYARSGQKPFLFAKYPAEVGDTFTSTIGQIEAKSTVAATGLEIKVPAGTFYCHQYTQVVGPQKVTTNYYFAPGMGLIKMEVIDRRGKTPIIENRLIEIKRK